MDIITSHQNTRIKNIVKLQKSKERSKQNVFLLEGARELTLALSANYKIQSIYYCKDLLSKSKYSNVLNTISNIELNEVSLSVFEKLAYREGSDGIIALVEPRTHSLDNLILKEKPFIIVLESIEKPGNLGAILRTADAAQVDAIIVCDPLTDVYNPNVIRSSIGCVFTNQIATVSSEEALNWLKERKIETFAAELNTDYWYHQVDYTNSSAIVMGTEADGLTDFWIKNVETRIKIPMRGTIDSLNVSTATAIITFEAMRQRGF